MVEGLTSDLNWGGGGWEAEETFLLVSLYFFGKIGGVTPLPHLGWLGINGEKFSVPYYCEIIGDHS